MKLYKYFRYNENFLSSLINEEIWFSCPQKLNDIFEFQVDKIISYNLNEQQPTRHIKFQDSLTESIYNVSGQPPVQFNSNFIDNFKYIWIASFSSNYDNSTMWSHYADWYKWVCIWYEVEEIWLQGPHKVIYSESFPNIDHNHIIPVFKTEEVIEPLFCTKGKDSEKEWEYRFLRKDWNKLYSYENMKIKISDVFFWFNLNLCRKNTIKKILDDKWTSLKYYDITLWEWLFELSKKECTFKNKTWK